MNFIDEQHVVRFEIGQDGGQVAGTFKDRAGGLAQVHAHFGGNDVAQRCLTQARRTEEQHVIERLAAFPGGLDEDFQLFADFHLTGIVGQPLGAQGTLERFLLGRFGLGRDDAVDGDQFVSFDHSSLSSRSQRCSSISPRASKTGPKKMPMKPKTSTPPKTPSAMSRMDSPAPRAIRMGLTKLSMLLITNRP